MPAGNTLVTTQRNNRGKFKLCTRDTRGILPPAFHYAHDVINLQDSIFPEPEIAFKRTLKSWLRKIGSDKDDLAVTRILVGAVLDAPTQSCILLKWKHNYCRCNGGVDKILYQFIL